MISDNFYSRFFHIFLLSLAITVCYSGTLEYSWHFDDIYNIVENENIHVSSLTWSEMSKAILSPISAKLFRPVAYFTFALNYYFSGLDTTGYHLVNIAIHILCAIFSYLVFVRTLEIYPGKAKFNSFFSISDIALLGAMLWALHPMQTQAVTYIVQRMASMAALFYMMAMYSYLCFRTGASRYRWIYLIMAVISWVAGIFTKENAALLPLSLVAYEFAFFGVSLGKHKRHALLLATSFVIISSVALYIMHGDIQKLLVESYSSRPFSMGERLLTEPIILFRYLLLLFLPIADFLSIESNHHVSTGLFSPPDTLPSLLLIFTLVSLSIYYVRKFPLICFAGLYYFLNHLVESTFLGLELYFEHRNYLPSIFIYLAISYYFSVIVQHYWEKRKAILYRLMVLLMTFIVISEGNATCIRNDVWESELTLLSDAIVKAPDNIRPYISLGVEYMKLNQPVKAREMYRKAENLLKLRPSGYQNNFIALLYYNAGIAAMRKIDNAKALQLILKSTDFDSFSWEAHANLGYLFFMTGDLKNAETALKNALEIRRDKEELYNMLGRVFYAKGELDEAERILQAGIKIKETSELDLNLVATYLRKKDVRSARTVLLKMPFAKNDVAYLLYRAAFFTEERNRMYNEVAEGLLNMNIDYCAWVSKAVNNNLPGLIYPEQFKEMEEDLRQVYLDKLRSRREKIAEREDFARSCDVSSPELVDSNQN